MNRISLLRKEYGISQEKLAEKLNLSKGSISLYENEERKPSLDVLEQLATIFNCSIDYLLGKSDIRKPEEIKFANNNGVNTEGLSQDEIDEIQKQVEFMRWRKKNESK